MNSRSALDRQARVDASLAWLQRYAPLLDDPAAFRTALGAPPPLDLLTLSQRITPPRLAEILVRRGLAVESIPGAPLHWRVTGGRGDGAFPEVTLGLAHPQGAASALPPQLLAPRPGETILDLCASPGGKTILLDVLADGRALIFAAEPSVGRAGILVQNLSRASVASTLVVKQDGRSFPALALFDAILLDAPCTGEGTFRIPSPRYDLAGEDGLRRAAALQLRLLRRALDLLAPGGRLVYSTCAYSPEENEAIVDAVLEGREGVTLAPTPAGFPGCPGVTSWSGRRFRPEMDRTRRIFPHHLGSWGFFVALLHKDPAAPAPRTRLPATAPDHPEVLEHLVREYGVAPESVAEFAAVRRGRDFWVQPRAALSADLGRVRVVAPGLRAAHAAAWGFSPTNAALRWLGRRIQRRVVDLDIAAALQLLSDGSIPWAGAGETSSLAVRVEGAVVGRARVQSGRLWFEIPARWR